MPATAHGEAVSLSGSLTATGVSNKWTLQVDYPNEVNSASGVPSRPDKVHKVSVLEPSVDTPGKITVEFDGTGETTEYNLAEETWNLEIFGRVAVPGDIVALITNPSIASVYRWHGKEHTTIDLLDTFDKIPGSQAIIIK